MRLARFAARSADLGSRLLGSATYSVDRARSERRCCARTRLSRRRRNVALSHRDLVDPAICTCPSSGRTRFGGVPRRLIVGRRLPCPQGRGVLQARVGLGVEPFPVGVVHPLFGKVMGELLDEVLLGARAGLFPPISALPRSVCHVASEDETGRRSRTHRRHHGFNPEPKKPARVGRPLRPATRKDCGNRKNASTSPRR